MNRIMKQADWNPEREGMSLADYKRMVSYMYQYENGVKKKNVGFARVEAKDGQCKITLHMQLLGQLDSIFPTYLLQRKHTDLELIYLGDTVLRNQAMDSKLVTEEGNVMNSGYSLADMGGLLLFLNDNVFFATEWDDKPILASEVLEALKPKAKREPKLTLEEELSIPKYKLPRGLKTIEQMQQKDSYLVERESRSWMKPELRRVSNLQAKKEEPGITVEEERKENNPMEAAAIERSEISTAAVLEVEAEEITVDPPIMQEASDTEIVFPADIEGNTKEEAEEGTTERADITEDKGGDDATESEEGQEKGDPEVATMIFEKHPRIYPFEDNEILLCAKIEPKDIGLLPKELWALSNNSFLVHGYYCYHHLIFAKMKDRSGCRYILGVPGIYHNREKFMAKMFGFDGFKPIRKRELRQGDFGYWYTSVCF